MIPINFDFGLHWNTRIVPFLDNNEVKESIRNGINEFLEVDLQEYIEDVFSSGITEIDISHFKKEYIEDTAPATYGEGGWYSTICDERDEYLFEQLKKENKLPPRLARMERILDHPELLSDIDRDFIEEQYCIEKMEFLNKQFPWSKIKYDLESYVVRSACHQMAPTLGITLARLVEPNEDWYVREGVDHTTVINRSHTKTFDLQYWALTGDRLNQRINPKPDWIDNDPTLGGRAAFESSDDTQTIHEEENTNIDN